MIACTAGVVTPNMVMPIAGRASRRRASRDVGGGQARDHARKRVGGVAEDLLGDEVEALNVGDRMHAS